MDGAFEGSLHALVVIGDIVVIAHDEEGGNPDAGQTFLIPRVVGGLFAPGRNGDNRFDVIAPDCLELQAVGEPVVDITSGHSRGKRAGFAVACAGAGQGAVAAHGIAHDRDVGDVGKSAEYGVGGNRVDGEQLVGRAIQQRGWKSADLAEDGIGMVDGGHHVAFRGQVFGEVGQEGPRAGVAVRHDHERELLAAHGRGVAQGFAGNLKRAARVLGAEHGAYVGGPLFLAGRNHGGIPNFQPERAVVERSFPGGLVELQDVDLIRMHDVERPDADRE